MQIKNQTYQNNQTSFKANIKFIDKAGFDTLASKIPKQMEAGRNGFGINDSIVEKEQAFTLDACDCMVGAIINPETKLINMFHIRPSKENISKLNQICETIMKHTEKLKGSSNVRLQGILVGGDCSSAIKPEDSQFRKVFTNLFNQISEKIGMDFSTIIGRKSSDSGINLISDADSNTHFINVFPSAENIQNEKSLSKSFNKVRIASTDSISFSC